MASTTYTGTTSATTAYASADVYTLNVAPSQITNVQNQGGNVVISTGATSLTITGVQLNQLIAANFVLQGGGSFIAGDNNAGNTNDSSGNTITGTGAADILLGLQGSDTINGGAGDNLIFGGNGMADSTDGADSITSTIGNDRIYGNAGDDTINSGSGSDTIYGGFGADQITVTPLSGQSAVVYGGGGVTDTADTSNDIINVGAAGANNAATGSAAVYGNAGADQINVFSSGSTSVYGGVGNDIITINGDGRALVFGGTADSDTITINGNGANTVYGGSSAADTADLNDTVVITGTGSNLVYGNGGNDTLTLTAGAGATGATASGNNTVYGGVGNDTIAITGAGNNLVVGGTADADQITITGNGNNTVYGGSSVNDTADLNDTIGITGSGNNLVYGNGGDDQITLTGATVGANTVLGNNTVYAGVGNDTIVASGGVTGVNGAASSTLQIFAGTGSDSINTQLVDFGTTTIYGGNGVNDSTDGADTIRAGDANDVIYGNGGNDVIQTGAGNDTIFGGAGVDRYLVDGAGNKTFGGFETGEQVIGNGAGINAANYTAAVNGNDVVLTSDTGRTLTFTNGVNSLINVGFTPAGGEADFVAGTLTANNVLLANFGSTAATLTGTAASDKIYSGIAADTIVLGTGDDTVFAGGGNDTINVAGNLTANDSIDGGAGTDVLGITGGADLTGVRNVEVLNVSVNTAANIVLGSADVVADGATLTLNGTGSLGAITFNGGLETGANAGRFNLTGGNGDDIFTGGAGADTLVGGAGADQLIGGAGNDSISGGDGNDVITGGAGVDILNGGAGTDTFIFRTIGDSGTPTVAVTAANVTAATLDQVQSYTLGTDIIDLDSSADGNGTDDAAVQADGANTFANGFVTGTLATNVASATSLGAAVNLVEAQLSANGVAGFVYQGSTYLVHNDGAGNNQIVDNVIQLTGVTGTTLTEAGGTSDTFVVA